MIRRTIALTALAAAATFGCRSAGTTPPTPSTPAERLEAILASEITLEQDSQFIAFAREQGQSEMMLMLPPLALDSTAHPLARANAVLRMGTVPMPDWDTYDRTILDPDPRVRGATLGVVGALAIRNPQRSIAILARGLVDTVIGIQAKALQELRDRDLELLEFYIQTTRIPELRDIALQTLRGAQAWGAPLEPERDGTLRRITPAGVEIVFRPARAFPELDMQVGTVSAALPGRPARVVADSIEVVATIIPVAGDGSGRYLAVERDRHIVIHDLETGTSRDIGPGIAPRPLPFSPDFFYFRETHRTEEANGTSLAYQLVRAPYEGGEPAPFDVLAVLARPDLRGSLSPVRWARVIDLGRRFVIVTDGVRNHPLPSPVDILPDDGSGN